MTAATIAIVLIVLPVFALMSWLFTFIYTLFSGLENATAGLWTAGVITSTLIVLGLLI